MQLLNYGFVFAGQKDMNQRLDIFLKHSSPAQTPTGMFKL